MKLVLDTNVIIDWLVFDDPYMNPLRDAVRTRRITILTHAPALDELRRVLTYPALKLSTQRQHEVLGDYESQTVIPSLPDDSVVPPGFPRCRDPDDNPFLSLAYHSNATALITRDRALLKLRRRTPKFGFQILDVQQLITSLTPTSP